MPEQRSMRRLQGWVQEVITNPDGIAVGVESPAAKQQIDIDVSSIEQVVEPSSRMDSTERLAVYGNAYFARLVECLGEEFPATRYAIGEENFKSFAFAYVNDSPSSSYSLGFLGEQFAQYLIDTRPADVSKPGWPDFLIDLATLERTYAEFFDGLGPEHLDTLKLQDLQTVPPDLVNEVRFVPVPSLRLLEASFSVHEYVTAVRRDQSPVIPLPAETLLVITRREYVVRRGPVSRTEIQLLRAILDGNSLGAAIKIAAEAMPDMADEELASNLSKWFQHWASAGWFIRVELPDS